MLIQLGIHWVDPVDFYQIWNVCRFFLQIGLSTLPPPFWVSNYTYCRPVESLPNLWGPGAFFFLFSLFSLWTLFCAASAAMFSSSLIFLLYYQICYSSHQVYFFTSGFFFIHTAVIFISSFSLHQTCVFLYTLEHMEQIHNGRVNVLSVNTLFPVTAWSAPIDWFFS